MENCVWDKIIQQQDKCSFVKNECLECYSIQLFFCKMNENYLYLVLMFLVAIMLNFQYLGSLVEKYLTPSLTKIASKLNMSESLAGVTFLALANGSNDIVASYVAGSETGGLSYVIGALFGAGFFTSTLIFGLVIRLSGHIKVTSEETGRDILFYIIGCIYIFLVAFDGKITMNESIGFFVIYGTYIYFVFLTERARS